MPQQWMGLLYRVANTLPWGRRWCQGPNKWGEGTVYGQTWNWRAIISTCVIFEGKDHYAIQRAEVKLRNCSARWKSRSCEYFTAAGCIIQFDRQVVYTCIQSNLYNSHFGHRGEWLLWRVRCYREKGI